MAIAGETTADAEVGRLERAAVDYLRRRASSLPPAAGASMRPREAVVLSRAQQARLRLVQALAIVRSGVAGSVFGAIAGLGEMVARSGYGDEAAPKTVPELVQFWGTISVFALAATIAEIAYLYWDGLRSVHKLAVIAEVELFTAEAERRAIAHALARAALELPNPRRKVFGVDPMREVNNTRLVVGTLAYKAKIAATKAILKAVLRRALARAMVRSFVPLIGVPVVALWNCVITWRVMREARIRAMGPSAARELAQAAFSAAPVELSKAARVAAVHAVGSAIVRTRDLHPNAEALLHEVVARTGEHEDETVDDPGAFIASLKSLEGAERKLALAVLLAAVVVDGALAKHEERLLVEAYEAVGATPPIERARAMAKALVRGDGMASV